ncbi:MAG: hypothetical protein JJU28_21200 [Cyclobacteriaceae bacterium]|nr:hypothetical protein [Cyclobacteriaceae bacterium]
MWNNSSLFFLPFLTTLALIWSSCLSKEKNADTMLLGEWHATWNGSGEVSDEMEEALTMDGKISFFADGTAIIEAYGYKGCAFTCDTLTTHINWKLDNQVLRFLENDDAFGLPYTIEKINSQSIELALIDDIRLSLTK